MTSLQVRAALFATAFFAILTLAAPAAAQDASALVEQGLALREQGEDAEALRRFEAAYALEAAPRTRAQIALAEMALSRWLAAEQHLVEALATQDDWVQRNRVALNGAMAGIREHIGRLQVEADQPGAELWIDGERVGSLPLPSPIARDPGAVSFEVRADGFETEARTVTLGGGQVTREVVRLRAVGAPEAEPEAETTAQPASGAGVFDAPAAGGGLSIPGVVLLAGGGAVAVAGAVLLGVAFSSKASLESPGDRRAWTADDQAAAEQVPVLAGAGEVLVGVGVAAAVVGVILMVVEGGGDDSQARLRGGRLEVRF